MWRQRGEYIPVGIDEREARRKDYFGDAYCCKEHKRIEGRREDGGREGRTETGRERE